MIYVKYVSGRGQKEDSDNLETKNIMERDQLGLSYNIRMCNTEGEYGGLVLIHVVQNTVQSRAAVNVFELRKSWEISLAAEGLLLFHNNSTQLLPWLRRKHLLHDLNT
jgi:hypothetical protein